MKFVCMGFGAGMELLGSNLEVTIDDTEAEQITVTICDSR